MAETAVNFVLGKLAEMIIKEAQFLGEVGDKVKWVETELKRIKCYLTDADSKRRKGDARAENWLNELRDVAYRIEDATDTFYVEIEDNHRKLDDNSQKDRCCSLGKLKRLGRKTTKLPALHNLGTELDGIKKELEGISRSKVDYDIDPLRERGEGEIVLMPSRRAIYQDVDETKVVGLKSDKNNVRKLLLDPEIRSRAVVTIVGSGGLGKTTLAHMVYKSVQPNFDFHMMLSVSKQFSPTDLLRKILTKLKDSEPTTRDISDLIIELKDLLNSKRYLIILDDVWETDLWNQYLKDALPDVENGSRVLMTSRLIEVAQSADPIIKPYELPFLNEEDSRNLLIKKALPYQKSSEYCLDDLYELVAALSTKCKGLPLALIVLGGILSTKDPYPAWEKVLETMDWHSDGKDCFHILAMSYEDMPCDLKACFMYLASFCEDSEISAKRLIRMWAAEGFMEQQGRKTMEETAEDCLEQLFQRSMVQVSSRRVDGSIKYCRVHDLLRDIAIHQARKENFVTVFADPQDINNCGRPTRRASLQSHGSQLMEYVGSKTRSLFLFDLKNKVTLPNYSEFSLLRVLEIVSSVWRMEVIKLRGVDRLIHLKYLGVRNFHEIDMSECSLGRLKNLETFDFQGNHGISYLLQEFDVFDDLDNKISNLPTDLWTINTLRHVFYMLPEVPSTANLPNLQTLEWISFNNKPIPRFNDLRRLGLINVCRKWDLDHAVPHLLGGLSSLTSLKIMSDFADLESYFPMEIVYPTALPNYRKLQILYLEGIWSSSVTLKASLFPRDLTKLTLSNSNLAQDPMPELGKLKNLKKLKLIRGVYIGRQMVCPAGFPVLQTLKLYIDLDVLTIAKGVMPKIKNLMRNNYTKLEMLPEFIDEGTSPEKVPRGTASGVSHGTSSEHDSNQTRKRTPPKSNSDFDGDFCLATLYL